MFTTHHLDLPHRGKLTFKVYSRNLVRRDFAFTALRLALLAGSLAFLINNGDALLKGQMTRQRWLTATLPYMLSIYGQSKCQLKHKP